MRPNQLFFIFLLLIVSAASAQEETRTQLKISNQKNEPLSFATVTVVSVPDTIHQVQKICDSNGKVDFQLTQNKPYIIRITAAGYKPLEKHLTIKAGQNEYHFVAEPDSKSMNSIVVTAARPMMRQDDDKTIVDPEQLVTASTNAYEILEKTPGMFIDQDGNVYLSSTTPARIYINGREQKMSAADVATMLKNLPPNAVASIEIMRTPSARYDASGGGGIVNIILKKGVKPGLTGSATVGMNQGKYGNQFVGLNLNNNNSGGLSTYLNLQYGRRGNYEQIKTDRSFSADSVLSQDALTKYFGDNFYVGYGASYQLSKKWDLTYDGRFSFNNNDNNSSNYSVIKKSSTGEAITANEIHVQTRGNIANLNQGLNLKYKIDSLGSEWTTDLSYTGNPATTDQYFETGYGHLENKLHFFSAQSNLVKKLRGQVTAETGVKTTGVNFTNLTDYYKNTGSGSVKDEVRSGSYKYRENINSAFVQLSKNFSGVIVKVGTRMENTNMQGDQLSPVDTSFNVHRTDFFPYIYISKTVMKIAGYDLRAYLVYRRTISRPAYEYLNPSMRFIDPYLYETGNPSLKPQFTQNYEANVSVDERPIVAVGFNDTKDIFTQVVYPLDSSNRISTRTYDNLGSNKETYIRLMGAIPPGGKYFGVVWAQYNHNFYDGAYENKPLAYKKGSWTFFTYHLIKLTPLTNLSLNGFVRVNGQQQFYELSTYGEARASVNQLLFKKKLTLSLSASDIFNTNQNEFTIDQGSIHASGVRKSDTQRFGINLRYNFGIRKKEEGVNPFTIQPQ